VSSNGVAAFFVHVGSGKGLPVDERDEAVAGDRLMATTEFTADELHDLEETSTLSRFLCLPLAAIGLVALAYRWPGPEWYWQAAWTVFTSYWLFCWTSCFHETAHQTLCSSKAFSIALGRVLGTAMGVPYTVYRESHIRHHAYLNKPRDWELWPYSDPRTSTAFRRVFVWIDLILGFVVSPYIYGRIFFDKESPLTKPEVRRTVRLEYAVIFLFWGGLFAAAGVYGFVDDVVRVWVLPHWLAGIQQTGRKLTEHLGMSSYDPMLGTRTVLGTGWFTKFCTWANFGIFVHGPHHRHPRLSHDLLEVKMNAYIGEHPEGPFPLYRTYTGATLAMVPHLFRNPGVGINAGAEPPKEERVRDVQNFVADVTSEVLAETDARVAEAANVN
jgi:fatty acid desaturase